LDRLRFLVETYLDYQKDRIRCENRLRSLPKQFAEERFFRELADAAADFEKMIAEEMARELKGEPLYEQYLRYQKGIGPVLAAQLIAFLARPRDVVIYGVTKKLSDGSYERRLRSAKVVLELPPYAIVKEEQLKAKPKYVRVELPPVMAVASNPSKLHMYCGLSPGSRLKRGERVRYNPKVKGLMYRVFRQLLMAKGEWSKIYERERETYEKRCPEPEKGSRKLKVFLTAKNIVMRRFVTNMWLVYRWMNGLPTTRPYAFEKMGHPEVEFQKPFIETEKGIVYLSKESF